MVVRGLKTRLNKHQVFLDIRDICARVSTDPVRAGQLEQAAWRWWQAGFRNALQLRRLIELEVYYNGGLFDQAERTGMIGNEPPSYATYVNLLEMFDRG